MGKSVCQQCHGIPRLPYIKWHNDADRRHKAGERQVKCPRCSLWCWPTLMKPMKDAKEGQEDG